MSHEDISPYDAGASAKIDKEIRIEKAIRALGRAPRLDPYDLGSVGKFNRHFERIRKIREKAIVDRFLP